MKLLRKSCLSGQLPASARAEGAALSAGADAAPRPGRARREPEDAAARGGTGMGSAETERRRCPARPGLPQGADEAVDGALRVQGHDVPYVEEAGHFIRHAASCSKVDVLPLLCALAALSREPPQQSGTERTAAAPRAAAEGTARATECRARFCRAPGEPARSDAAAADTPRRAQPGHPKSRRRRRCGRFPVPFRSFLSNTFAPPPPPTSSSSPPFSAPRRSRHRHPEGASGCRAP